MSHADKLYRFLFDELDIRGELVYLNETWREVTSRDDYPQPVQRQLGEALLASAILSSTVKHEGSLILQIQGEGPLSTLVTHADREGNLRGLAKWRGDVPDSDLNAVYGSGQLAITMQNTGGERYQSIVSLDGACLANALENYFLNSEQLASRFWLFSDAGKVAGLFVQQLPATGAREEDWQRICALADTITRDETLSLSPEELLQRLFHEEKVRLFEPRALRFSCHCSRQRIEGTLAAMDKSALREILNAEGSIEVDCEFCNQHYSFSHSDIDSLSGPGDNAPDRTVH